jgi:FPC/CPF motif-containing protein YcgG
MEEDVIKTLYFNFLSGKMFPCVAAKAALNMKHIAVLVAMDIRCPHEDEKILEFLYAFIDAYRGTNSPYHSAAVIFKQPSEISEEEYEHNFWKRLISFQNSDRKKYRHDPRVDADPSSEKFSFSLKEEALFVIGLHPSNSRLARKFAYPTLVFNPHQEFEKLRSNNRYNKMRDVVRSRDLRYSGSINPMLHNFGEISEVYQYTGKQYDQDWKCPLNARHDAT